MGEAQYSGGKWGIEASGGWHSRELGKLDCKVGGKVSYRVG